MTERRTGPRETRSNVEVTTTDTASLGKTSRRIPHWTGCPAGCGSWHECGVGEPIEVVVDFSRSAIWTGNPPKLSDLQSTAVAA
jgi:hypothetical protein